MPDDGGDLLDAAPPGGAPVTDPPGPATGPRDGAGEAGTGEAGTGAPGAPRPDEQPLCDRARELADGDPESDEERDEIVQLLRRALACGEPDASGLLATALLERGDRLGAIEVLSPAVHTHGRIDLAGVLGDTLAEVGDHDAAEEAFLVGLDAGEVGALNDYGVFLRDRGRAQEASYVLDRAARAGDDLAALNLVALHLEELDDPGTATALAEEFAEEARPSSLVALADARLATGRVDEADTLYRRATELGAPCAHIYYGWFLQDRREDLDGAEMHLRLACEADETGASYHLARFLFDAGRADEARPLFEEAAFHGDADAAEVLETEYAGLVDHWDD